MPGGCGWWSVKSYRSRARAKLTESHWWRICARKGRRVRTAIATKRISNRGDETRVLSAGITATVAESLAILRGDRQTRAAGRSVSSRIDPSQHARQGSTTSLPLPTCRQLQASAPPFVLAIQTRSRAPRAGSPNRRARGRTFWNDRMRIGSVEPVELRSGKLLLLRNSTRSPLQSEGRDAARERACWLENWRLSRPDC